MQLFFVSKSIQSLFLVYLVCSKRIAKDIEFTIRVTSVVSEQITRVATLSWLAWWTCIVGATTSWIFRPHTAAHHIYLLDILLEMWILHKKDPNICMSSYYENGNRTCRYFFFQHLLGSRLSKRRVPPAALVQEQMYVTYINIMSLGETLKSRSSNSTINTTNAKLMDSVPLEILMKIC